MVNQKAGFLMCPAFRDNALKGLISPRRTISQLGDPKECKKSRGQMSVCGFWIGATGGVRTVVQLEGPSPCANSNPGFRAQVPRRTILPFVRIGNGRYSSIARAWRGLKTVTARGWDVEAPRRPTMCRCQLAHPLPALAPLGRRPLGHQPPLVQEPLVL
ncbi:uncharacterized protein BJX67DRAFT_32005 [Aspergillus lucknowensis]|uniref:Uncharacterized protein n=1 Tax=Aspergillus lucknowensis TaxID=176173 RepID=A0ABR4M0H1_9EURO